MYLEIGDRVLIKKITKISKYLPFGKRKYDWIANVISTKGDIMDFSPPKINLDNIYKYIDKPEYEIIVLRPIPSFSIAQKAIWFRKIKMLEGKLFTRKNKNVSINTIEDKKTIGAGTATLLADNHCSKLDIESINSPSDYLKLVQEGEFEILYDSQKD